jgi:hypothetical protein
MRVPGRTAARYALLTDGSTVLIRPATPADADASRTRPSPFWTSVAEGVFPASSFWIGGGAELYSPTLW